MCVCVNVFVLQCVADGDERTWKHMIYPFLAMFSAIPQDHVQQYMLPQTTSPQEIQLLVMINGGNLQYMGRGMMGLL